MAFSRFAVLALLLTAAHARMLAETPSAFVSLTSSAGSTAQAPAAYAPALAPSADVATISTVSPAKTATFDGACTFTVDAADNTTFTTIDAAVEAVGPLNDKPVTICVKPGLYKEVVKVKKGQNQITLQGLGLASEIILSGGNTQNDTGNLWTAATLYVEGNNFAAANMTIENTSTQPKMPAPAVSILSDTTTWENVSFTSYQDTVGLRQGGHLFKWCTVGGLSDTIFGFGRAAFVYSTIVVRALGDPKKYIGSVTALGTLPGSTPEAGAVFWDSKIVGDGQSFLGRPYRPEVTVVFVRTEMSAAVIGGWTDWNANLTRESGTLLEYGSFGPGAGARETGTVFPATIAPPKEYLPQFFVGQS